MLKSYFKISNIFFYLIFNFYTKTITLIHNIYFLDKILA